MALFECECGASFTTLGDLKTHITRDHPGDDYKHRAHKVYAFGY